MTRTLTSTFVLRAAGVLALSMAVCAPLKAHRLDEYLQAIRVDVDRNAITLELDLTPGVGIAKSVLMAIDVDADATISAAEADAYARRVLNELNVTLDGTSRSPALTRLDSPAYADIEDGTGVIRLVATMAAASEDGRHRLVLRNDHRPDVSVHLANALLPVSGDVTIASQTRDPLQRSLSIEYALERPISAGESASWTMFALVLVGVLVYRRR